MDKLPCKIQFTSKINERYDRYGQVKLTVGSNRMLEVQAKITYYVHPKAEMHENRRFFSTGMEFAKNANAFVLKAQSRN